MNTLTQDQLREIYNSLPEDLQNAMGAPETSEAVRRISNNYGLSLDQMGDLTEEIGLAMLGVNTLEDLPKNIALRLGVDLAMGNAIFRDVNGSVFLKVQESLKRVNELRGSNPLLTYSTQKQDTIPSVTPISEPLTEKPVTQPIPQTPSAPLSTKAGNDPYREEIE